MDPRKRRGILMFANGVLICVGGILTFSLTSIPLFWPIVIQVVGLIAGFFGFRTVYPDS